jgi:protein-L-isoaspartate(D-aspartate) O-methyltransferase
MTELQQERPPVEQYRRFYAEEIRAVAHLTNPRLFEAFARVPREKFLGSPPWHYGGELSLRPAPYRSTHDPRDVYHNVAIALKPAQNLNNGQPGALASWIGALHLAEGDRVFHVGCGTGYFTAILAETVGPSGAVVAAEVDPDLAGQASAGLRSYPSVTVHCADGATIDPRPCDAIFINAGVTHPHVAWLTGLKEGGRLVLPLTVAMAPGLGKGLMVKVTRQGGRFAAEVLSMVAIYSSTSNRDSAVEALLTKAFESRELMKLQSIRLDAHEPAPTCLVHAPGVCVSAETAAPPSA